jgi:metallo-beta-lactamase family protein
MSSLRFLGAAGTVTGSKFLLEAGGVRLLIDCGLFQGLKELRLRNWAPWPVDPKSIDAVVLTHAHVDHTGGLPRLVSMGFKGPVFGTPGTRELSALLLPDSAHLQEEEARYANRHGYSKHKPALPLYTVADAEASLGLFQTFGFGQPKEILPGVSLAFWRAGHILGSAICSFKLFKEKQSLVFTGDLGRYQGPLLHSPDAVYFATTLVAESTYGDRLHGPDRPLDELADAVNTASRRGGMIVIPAFAIGRTQEILYYLRILEEQRTIPVLDVFVDSPMARDATPIYLAHPEEHSLEMAKLLSQGQSPLRTQKTRFVNSVDESKRLNSLHGPAIIISASGMATGGRVLHHLKHRLPDPRNLVLFVGYQAEGTRGRRLLDGEGQIPILGSLVSVKAEIRYISGFSAHADWKEMLRWMDGIRDVPQQVFLVHGEPSALEALRVRVVEKGWPARVPQYLETVDLKESS